MTEQREMKIKADKSEINQLELRITVVNSDNVDTSIFINEEQARDLVRHLNRVFDLGLRG